MDQKTDRRVRLAANFIIVLFVLLTIYLFFTKAISCILPFIFALVLAYCIEPVVNFFENKLHLKRAVASIITIILSLIVLFSAVSYLIYILVLQIISLAQQLPQFLNAATVYITELTNQWRIFNATLPVGISQFLENVLITVNQNLSTIVDPLTKITLNGAKSFAALLPQMVFFTVIFIIATFFISVDKMVIGKFIIKQMSEKAKENLYKVKDYMVNAFFKYVKAILIIMFITFLELFIGFSIIRIENALLLALIICLVDILPVLGTGTVLIPWGLICLVMGNFRVGISLIILYAVIAFVRQFIEPKIVSVQIGLYPLVTLMSMYIGFKFFGIAGMFYGPFFMVFVICLNRAGIIHLFRGETLETENELFKKRIHKKS